MSSPQIKSTKTYKRETSWGLLAGLAATTFYYLYSGDSNALEALKILVVPVLGFCSVAFGMDAYSKQVLPGNK